MDVKDPEPEVFIAIRNDNIEKVKQMINSDKKLLRERFEGDNVVSLAGSLGNVKMLKILLELGGRVNAENQKTGYTLVHHAAKQNNEDLFDLLMSKGKNLKLALPELEHGLSPLHIAAIEGNYVMAERLISAEAPLNQRDTFGYTPLHVACLKRNLAIGQLLTETYPLAAKLRAYEHADEMLPIHIAADQVDPDMMEVLSQVSPLLSGDKNGMTVMHYLAKHGFVELVNLYLSAVERTFNAGRINELAVELDDEGFGKEDLEQIQNERSSKLKSSFTTFDEVRKFIFDAPAKDGRSPLMIAVDSGHQDLVKFFISMGCDVNQQLTIGLSPLHFAVRNGDLIMVNALLKAGAAVNAKTRSDITPLHFAVRFGRMELFEVLLENGANWEEIDAAGSAPIQLDSSSATCHDVGFLRKLVVRREGEAIVKATEMRLDEEKKKREQAQKDASSTINHTDHVHDENCKH